MRKIHPPLLLSLLVFLLLCSSSHGDPPRNEAEFRGFLKECTGLLLEYRNTIDAAQFDLAVLSETIDGGPDGIFRFVRDEIPYQPYAGALRGAVGCLSARSGNAVDKSLLLADLLQRSGHKVRFAFGTLSPQEAEILVTDSLLWEPDEAAADLDLPYYYDSPAIMKERDEAVAAVEKRLENRLNRLFDAVNRALAPHVVERTGGVPIERLSKEAARHVWVQVKRGEEYVDLDPSFQWTEPGETRASVEKTLPEIPREWRHKVTFRGIVEKFDGKKVSTETLWETGIDAADLAGDPIVVSCSKELDGVARFGEALSGADSRCLRIYIDGKRIRGTDFQFTSPRKKPSSPWGALEGPLGGGGGVTPFVSAVAVEVRLEGPDGPGAPIRRYLLDRWGHDGRTRNRIDDLKNAKPDPKRSASLDNTVLCFAVETGAISPHLLQRRTVDVSLAKFRGIRVADGKVSMDGGVGDMVARTFADAHFHLQDRFAIGRFEQGGFAFEPRLVMARFETDAPSVRMTFDVTRDRRRFLTEGTDDPYETSLKHGLLAAIVEEELTFDPIAATAAPPGSTAKGSAQLLEESLPRAPPKVVRTAEEIPSASADAQARMREAVSAGRLVVVPSVENPSGWFEFDPAAGRLEAVTETGLHSAGTERSSLESKTPQKTLSATRFRDVLRAMKRCFIANIDEIIHLIVAQAGGTIAVNDVLGGVQGAAECLANAKGSKLKRTASRRAGSQKWNTKKNADLLRKNMAKAMGKKKFPRGRHAHHMVPSTHRRGWEARSLLHKFGIDVNSAMNGANLTHRRHKGLHSFKYMDWVTQQLKKAKTRKEAEQVLDRIRTTLTQGKRPWLR